MLYRVRKSTPTEELGRPSLSFIFKINKKQFLLKGSIFLQMSREIVVFVGCVTCYVECVTMSSRTAMYAGIWFWRVKNMCSEIIPKVRSLCFNNTLFSSALSVQHIAGIEVLVHV